MNINPSAWSAPILQSQGGAAAAPAQPNQTEQTRALRQAVQKLNSSSLVPGNRELSLSIDPKTKIPVVRVLDSNTHEVLDQIPAEYILRVTAYLESAQAHESLSNIPFLNR